MTGIYFKTNYSQNNDQHPLNTNYSLIRSDGRFAFEYRRSELIVLYTETSLELLVKSGLTEFVISILYSSNGEIRVEYPNVIETAQNIENTTIDETPNNNYIKFTPMEIEKEHNAIKKANYLAAKLTTIFNYILLEPVDIKINIKKDDGNLLSLIINHIMLGLCLTGHQCSDYIISSQISIKNNFIIKDLLYSEEKLYPSLLGVWEMNSKRNLAVFTEGSLLKDDLKILYKESEDECKQIFKEMKEILVKISQKI